MNFEVSSKDHLILENLRGFIVQIFREVVREELAKNFGLQHSALNKLPEGIRNAIISGNSVPSKISQNWLTHIEAAAYLKMTAPVLYKLSSLRKIKFSKRGKRNYYKIEHLEQYLTEGEIQTQEEIKQQIQLKGKMKIV